MLSLLVFWSFFKAGNGSNRSTVVGNILHSFPHVLTAHNRPRPTGLTKHRASSFCQSDSILRSMWMVRLGLLTIFCTGILKLNPIFIPCNYTMQKTIFQTSEQKSHVFLRFSICLSFNSCDTHLSVFWIFPISHSRLETACWLTSNCSASCLRVCESSSFNNPFNFTSSIFLLFSTFLVFLLILCRSHHFLKRRNRRSKKTLCAQILTGTRLLHLTNKHSFRRVFITITCQIR